MIGEDLDRDSSIETSISRAIDLSHPARAQRRKDFVGPKSCAGGNRHSVLVKVADQDHVARLRAAREGELAAVAREVEPEDLVGLEVRQLYRLPAVQRQRPDVRDAVDCVYVGQGASVRRPAQTGSTAEAVREVEHLDG